MGDWFRAAKEYLAPSTAATRESSSAEDELLDVEPDLETCPEQEHSKTTCEVITDELPEYEPVPPQKQSRLYAGWVWVCGSPKRQCLALTVLVVGLLVLLLPIVFWVVVPVVTQSCIQGANIRLLAAQISNATSNTLFLNATLQISDAGPFNAALDSFTASLHSGERVIGQIRFPPVSIAGSASTTVKVAAPIQVSDSSALRSSLRQMFAGKDVQWVAEADLELTVLGFLRTSSALRNPITLPAVPIDYALASDLEPTSGNGTSGEMNASVTMSFYSWSILEIVGIGDLTLEMFYLDKLTNTNKLGQVVLQDFKCLKGRNRINGTALVELNDHNYASVSTMFGNYASQQSTAGVVRGPVACSANADYLLNVLSQPFKMQGAVREMFGTAQMGRELTVQGINPTTGDLCALPQMDLEHCMRGALVTGKSAFKKALLYRSFSLDVDWDLPVPAYNVTTFFWGYPGTASCRETKALGRMYSQAGIYSYNKAHNRSYSPDPTVAHKQRLADDMITDAGNYESFAFFLGARDRPGQAQAVNRWGPGYPKKYADGSCFDALGPLDCCMMTSFTAMACHAKHNLGAETIALTASGNVTVFVDSWKINVSSTHNLNLGWSTDVMDFEIVDPVQGLLMNWNCSTITFL